jgi:hypothetical protein
MRYRYCIFYTFRLISYESGNGWMEIQRNTPICGSADLQQIKVDLTQELRATNLPNIESLTVTGWQRFEDPDGHEREL